MIVISTQNSRYLEWQTKFLEFSAGRYVPGTPVLELQTHFTPPRLYLVTENPRKLIVRESGKDEYTKDDYTPYNKPNALWEWVLQFQPRDEDVTVHILDPDCVFLFEPEKRIFGRVPKGSPQGEYIFYLDQDCVQKYPRLQNFTKAPPETWQPIGIPISIHLSDLRRLLPRWICLLKEMRSNKLLVQEIPWVLEMWAYSIAVAELGIVHEVKLRQHAPNDVRLTRAICHYCYDTSYKGWKWSKRSWLPGDVHNPPYTFLTEVGRKFHELLQEFLNFEMRKT